MFLFLRRCVSEINLLCYLLNSFSAGSGASFESGINVIVNMRTTTEVRVILGEDLFEKIITCVLVIFTDF